jgi:hypothetical protein
MVLAKVRMEEMRKALGMPVNKDQVSEAKES